jgi:hypothetical protein
MNMKRSLAAFALMLLVTPLMAATKDEPNRAARVLAETPGLITLADDDGGRVEVFRHGAAARQLTFHGGAVVKEPVVLMIFLGDWSTPSAAKRKADLQRQVGQISTSESFQSASAYGVRTTGLLLSSRDIAAGGSLNDLRIQSKIDAGMTDGSLSQRDENVIHLVFLSPALQSVLSSSVAGRDYHSYHSHVQLQDINVRYVVVPYDQDLGRMSEAAKQSFVRAVVNPDGDGWY